MRQLRIRASVLSLSVLLFGAPLGAADKYWTGAAGDGRWWNAANWSGNSFAGYGDTVIFTNDAPLTLSRAGAPNDGTTASANRIYRFEGADVTFVRDSALWIWGPPEVVPQPEIYVAAGTTVTISNSVLMFNRGSLVKSGGGTVRQYGVYGEGSNNQSVQLMSGECPFFRLAEGQWIIESPSAGAYCNVTNVIVETGSTFTLKGYNSLNERAKWTVDGTFRLETGESSANISTLVGSGRVETTAAGRLLNLQILNGVQGPSSFSGAIGAGVSLIFTNRVPVASRDFTFTLGVANVFADADLVHGFYTDRLAGDLSALRFAPGIGAFTLKNVCVNAPLTLSATDTDGHGVEVRLNAWRQTTRAPVTLTLAGGRFCGVPSASTSSLDANRTLPEPSFITLDGEARRNLVVAGGDVYVGNSGELAELTVRDGGAAYVAYGYPASAEKPSAIRLDGGTLLMAARNPNVYHSPFAAEAAASHVSVAVGASGAKIGVDDPRLSDAVWSHLNVPIDPATGVADGGLELLPAYGPLALNQPIRLLGGVKAWGGRLILESSAALRTTPKFLGLGDVSLASTLLLFNDFAVGEEASLEIPGAFSYGESVTVNFRSEASKAANAMSCGSLVRAGAGAVLFLFDPVALGSASTFKVAAAPATHANGLLKQPVVLDSAGLNLAFAACDAEKGIVPFADMKADAAAGEGDVLSIEAGSYTVPADTEKRVLGVAGSPWKSVTIPATATLKVGNGTDPALVLLNTSTVSGGGTLDFGTSEGVIAANYHPYANGVSCRIAGSGGVTFAASAKFRKMVVSGASVYSGGTRVTSVDLWVRHATAFGTGDVFVLGDARNGGKLLFDRPLTMANDFHVSGWGHPFNEWNVASNGYGAVVFKANAVELTGAVELVREARMSAEKAGDVGRLSGVVSGGRLSIYKGEGLVELLNENTYTGGTEVVGATVAVAKGGGLGTGTVTLDQGVLRFINTEAITFTNAVEGVGTIVLAGTAPVTFKGASFAGLPFATLAAGTVLNLASPADSVYMPFFAGETDLGGRRLTVGGVAGSGRGSNGVLTVTGEISPAGEGAVGTLAFAAGTLVSSGATYVCDVADGAADRLVVGGDFDLSTLGFRAVRCGRARGVSPTVLESENGSLSGAFASVALARRAWQVAYGARAVNLDLNAGLLLLVK